MRLRSIWTSMLALLLVATTLVPLPAKAGAKRRIAILPFSYGAVESSVGTCDVGKGITTLLITKLVQDGTYSVVDREMLDSILKEQNLSVSDRADPATACKIGKILSVDAIITGTVTQFGVEHTSTGIHIPSVSVPYVGLGSLGTIRSNKTHAKVGIDARLIDINTTEVLATANGTGESKSKGNWSLNPDWDFCGSDFKSTVAGEATLSAVDQLIGQLTAAASKIPDNQSLAAASVQGKIADVTGDQVVVNVGKKNGVKVGDNLQVERVTKTIKDPSSGKVIKEVTSTIALVNITESDPDSATGTVVKGSNMRVGDLVRKVTTDVSAIIITPLAGSTSAADTSKPTATATKPKSK